MTRKELEIILPFMNALAEGKIIQRNDPENGTDDWWDMEVVDFTDLESIAENPSSYRIKRAPTYRPFKNAEECWNETQKHQPFGWAKSINNTDPEVFIYCEAITKIDGILTSMDEVPFSYDNMYRNYTFADGTPFGMKEE